MLATARAFPLWSRCKKAIKQNWSSRSSSHRFQGRLYKRRRGSRVYRVSSLLFLSVTRILKVPVGMVPWLVAVMCEVWRCVGKVPHLPRASPVSLNCPRTSESVAEPRVMSSSNISTNQSSLFILRHRASPSTVHFNHPPISNADNLKGKRVVDGRY